MLAQECGRRVPARRDPKIPALPCVRASPAHAMPSVEPDRAPGRGRRRGSPCAHGPGGETRGAQPPGRLSVDVE